MKKLERLTLKELGESVEVLDRKETIGLKGGNADNGNAEFYMKYGENLPDGVGYDFLSDTCYPIGSSEGIVGAGGSGTGGNSNSSSDNSIPWWINSPEQQAINDREAAYWAQNIIGPSGEEQWAQANVGPWKFILGIGYVAAAAWTGLVIAAQNGPDFGYSVLDPQPNGSFGFSPHGVIIEQ
jgi:hypothetical protein